MLPARYGDSLVVQYGAGSMILVDGGTSGTNTDIVSALNKNGKRAKVELCVVTHIDRDHIEGVLSLLERTELPFDIDDFWFNGYKQLPDNPKKEIFGGVQGERLTVALTKHCISWNRHFDHGAVCISDAPSLPSISLPGGLKITLLSPEIPQLRSLKKQWANEVRKHNLDPANALKEKPDLPPGIQAFGALDVESLFEVNGKKDGSIANGSSIAFLAQFDNKSLLFTGDAHPHTILKSLNTLFGNATISIDAWKLSHHGSLHNTSKQLIERIDCKRYLFSTSSTKFPHPSYETIAWILKLKKDNTKELHFNYSSGRTTIWDDDKLKKEYNFLTVYPSPGKSGLTVTV